MHIIDWVTPRPVYLSKRWCYRIVHIQKLTPWCLKRDTQRGSLQNKPSIKTLYCRPIVASVFQACIRAVGVLYRGRIGLVDAMNSGGIPDSCRKLHSVSVWNIGGIGHFPPEFIETSNRNGTSWLSVTRTRSGGIGINILGGRMMGCSHSLFISGCDILCGRAIVLKLKRMP